MIEELRLKQLAATVTLTGDWSILGEYLRCSITTPSELPTVLTMLAAHDPGSNSDILRAAVGAVVIDCMWQWEPGPSAELLSGAMHSAWLTSSLLGLDNVFDAVSIQWGRGGSRAWTSDDISRLIQCVASYGRLLKSEQVHPHRIESLVDLMESALGLWGPECLGSPRPAILTTMEEAARRAAALGNRDLIDRLQSLARALTGGLLHP